MLVRLIMWQWWIVFLVFWVVLIILIIILFLLSFFLIVLPIITLVFFYFRTFSLLFTIPNLSALVLFDIGLFTTMLWSFEEREKLINFSEVLSGTRFHAAFVLMGRLRYDIALRWIDSFVYFLIHFTRKLKEIHYILSMNRLWRRRLYEIGIIERDFCFYFGFSGMLSRSAKIWLDARFTGYECYQGLDYSIFLASNSDCLDRYVLRFNEMIESCRIIYGILFRWLNEALKSFSSSCYSSCLFSIMEWLISSFLITFPFILFFIASSISFSMNNSLFYCFFDKFLNE